MKQASLLQLRKACPNSHFSNLSFTVTYLYIIVLFSFVFFGMLSLLRSLRLLQSKIKRNHTKSKGIIENQKESYISSTNCPLHPGLITRFPFHYGWNGRSVVKRGALRVFGKTRISQVKILVNLVVPAQNG